MEANYSILLNFCRKYTSKKSDEQRFEEEGWVFSKKLKMNAPLLESAAIPRRLKAGSTPLECFRVLWTNNIVQHIVNLIHSKIDKKGLQQKEVKSIISIFCFQMLC